jgi:predicted metal-dependent peptidase
MSTFARDDFSYSRPSRRTGEAILPSLKSHQIDIIVAIDTSGSISQEEVDEFVSEVSAIKSNLRASITLLACDDKLCEHSPWRFEIDIHQTQQAHKAFNAFFEINITA